MEDVALNFQGAVRGALEEIETDYRLAVNKEERSRNVRIGPISWIHFVK